MVVYWGMLIWVFLIGFFQPDERNPLKTNEAKEYRAKWGFAIMLMLPVIFFAAMRSGVGDTGMYIAMFEDTPDTMHYFIDYIEIQNKSVLFYGCQMLFKCYISDSPYMWLSFIAVIEGLLVTGFFRRYSPNIAMSVYIFVGSTMFTWMYNGMRQFLAVCIILSMTEWIVKNRWYAFIPVVLIVGGMVPFFEWFGAETVPWFFGGIHQSSLIMIPIFFILQGKAWGWRVWVFIVGFTILAFLGLVDDLVGDVAENSEYALNMEMNAASDDNGANPIRVLVAAVPAVMALIKRKEIIDMGEEVPPFIHLSINAAVVTVALYATSVISSSGIMIGRLTAYTELYGMVLIPWLLIYPYKKSQRTLAVCVYGAYLLWFIYQMYIAWGGAGYVSRLLGIGT